MLEPEPSFPLITASWLAVQIKQAQKANQAPNLIILDGSWHLPAAGRNAYQEYIEGHIPGARFFNIDEISDEDSPYPHMLPSPRKFAQYANALGVDNQSFIAVYDSYGLFSAARVWWMFRYFGHDRIGIIDGGLKAWKKLGLSLEEGTPPLPEPYGDFTPSTRSHLLTNRLQVETALNDKHEQIIDARPAARFRGEAPEPRPNLRLGHMPGAINLPFSLFSDSEHGYVLGLDQLKTLLDQHHISATDSFIASCGSGVSACTFAFIMALLGNNQVSIYDGSWAEWGSLPDTPIISGS